MNQNNKRRTEITIETHSVTIIRTRGGEPANLVYCRNCETHTPVFRFARAALIFRTSAAKLESLFQTSQIHSAENNDLCGNSLAAFFNQEIRCVED